MIPRVRDRIKIISSFCSLGDINTVVAIDMIDKKDIVVNGHYSNGK